MTASDTLLWPKDSVRQVSECPVCKHAGRELLYSGLIDAKFGAPGDWSLMRCLQCRSAYCDPQPTPDTISLAYKNYYTHIASPTRISKIASMRRAAVNGYINRRWGSSLRPASSLLSYIVDLSPLKKANIDHDVLRSLQSPKKVKADVLLLDVGCGNGTFLNLAAKAGWKVTGIDFDPAAVEQARETGLDIRLGGIDLFSSQSELFDCITISHVIEHVYEPVALIQACFRLLKRGGRLWIETPNIESDGHLKYRRHWRGLEPPRHLVIFNWDSLENLLKDCGFSDIKPAPWRPQRYWMDRESEQISSYFSPPAGIHRWIAMKLIRDEWNACQKHKQREFVTYTATKNY